MAYGVLQSRGLRVNFPTRGDEEVYSEMADAGNFPTGMDNGVLQPCVVVVNYTAT